MLLGIGSGLIASTIWSITKGEGTVDYLRRTGFTIGVIMVIKYFI